MRDFFTVTYGQTDGQLKYGGNTTLCTKRAARGTKTFKHIGLPSYLRQGGNVSAGLCLSVCVLAR